MKEFINYEDFMVGHGGVQSWTSVSDIPDCYVRRILGLDGNSRDFQPPDIITPLIKGKEWLFELTRQWQPKTAEIFLRGNLFVRPSKSSLLWDFPNLCLDVEGKVLILDRKSFGDNCCDAGYKNSSKIFKIKRQESLPEGIKYAYYWRFDGVNAPKTASVGAYTRIFPFPVGRPWQSWDGYLEQFPGYRKKYLRWLEEIIPDVSFERGMPCTDFMMFLDTRPTLRGREGDVFFVKNHIQDGKVYWIHDADITGMRELSDPVTAIDLYCAHVLGGREGIFDFREFSQPL